MVDYLRRFSDHVGLMQRLQEAMDAEKQGQVGGLQYGDIPVLGGLLRPAGLAANTLGLGMEAAGTAGSAIAGTAALPFVYGEAAFGSDNPQDQQRSQDLVNSGLGNLLSHPGRTIGSLRHSENDITSYLAGILEMASDPTNLIPFGGNAKITAAKEAGRASRAALGGTISADFLKGQADDVARAAEAKAAEEATRLGQQANLDDYQGAFKAARDRIGLLGEDLNDAQANLATAFVNKKGAASRYKAMAAEKTAAEKSASSLFDEASLDVPAELQGGPALRNRFIEGAKNEVAQQHGIPRGVDYKTYLNDANTAYRDSENEVNAITKLYAQAVREAPQPIKYGVDGTPLDKKLVGGIPNQPHINDVMNEELLRNTPTLTPEEHGWFIPDGPPDNPKAIAAGLGRVANAEELGPVLGPKAPDLAVPETKPFVSRMSDIISAALREGKVRQQAAMQSKGGPLGFKEIAGIWKGLQTETLRNIFQDEIYSRLVANSNDIRQAVFTSNKSLIGSRISEMGPDAAGKLEHPLAHAGAVGEVLSSLGYLNRLGPKEYAAEVAKLGLSPIEAETINVRNISAMQHMLVEGAMGLANPGRAAVGVLTLPFGYLAPMRQKAFQILNSVTHMAAKSSAMEQAVFPYLENSARVLLRTAEAEGKDVSALVGRNVVRDGETLMAEGLFTPGEAATILGPRYGAEWQRMIGEAVDQGYTRANQVFGNYSQRGKLEQAINTFFPFMSWAWRSYPRVAYMALQHPALTAAAIQLWQADAQQASETGRPAYQVPTIAINKDTPFVGVLAKIFSPDQEAEVRFNPLSIMLPFSGSNTAGFSDNANNDTTYEKVKNIVGAAGLSPNPLVGATAYSLGWDSQTPGALSRYAPIDQAQNEVFGDGVQVPSLLHGPLHALREQITGKPDTYDPVRNKANELIFEATGLPISDVRNAAAAKQLDDPNSPLMREAQRVLDEAGATRAAFNAVSPTSAMVNTETTQQRREASLDIPFTYEEIQAMKATAPGIATMMQAQNDEYLRTHPAAAINKKPQPVDPKQAAQDKAAAKRAQLRAAYGLAGR